MRSPPPPGSASAPEASRPTSNGPSRRSAPTAATSPSSRRRRNLVAGDTNGVSDVFVHDRADRHDRRASASPRGGAQANGLSEQTGDQRRRPLRRLQVRCATNLVPATPTARADVFVHDRVAGTTDAGQRRQRPAPRRTAAAYSPRSARDGRYVAFQSVGVEPGGRRHERRRGRLRARPRRPATTDAGERRPPAARQANSASFDAGDQRRRPLRRLRRPRAATWCRATPTASTDVFVHDRQTGHDRRGSASATGGAQAQRPQLRHRRSAPTAATSPSSPRQQPGCRRHQRHATTCSCTTGRRGTTERVSVATGGSAGERRQRPRRPISADGRYVAFHSDADEPGRRRHQRHVRTCSSTTGRPATTERVSVAAGGAAGELEQLRRLRSAPTAATSRSTPAPATWWPATPTAWPTSSCTTVAIPRRWTPMPTACPTTGRRGSGSIRRARQATTAPPATRTATAPTNSRSIRRDASARLLQALSGRRRGQRVLRRTARAAQRRQRHRRGCCCRYPAAGRRGR